MVIIRDYTPKDIMLITDFPLVKEAESGNAYSENSSLQMKDALIKASVIECKNRDKKHIIGTNEICLTYLSLERPEKGDGDWAKSILSKKDLSKNTHECRESYTNPTTNSTHIEPDKYHISIGDGGEIQYGAKVRLPREKIIEEDYVQIEWLKDVYVTKKVKQSLDGLLNQIRRVKPRLVILAGKWSFFFLASLVDNPSAQLATIAATKTTFKKQIFFGALNKYRASLLTFNETFGLPPIVVVPILTPAYHWVVKDKTVIIQRDYGKIASYYRRLKDGESPEDILVSNRHNIFPHSCNELAKDNLITYLAKLLDKLEDTPTKVVFDVETRHGFIDCIGICYQKDISLTIPFTELYYEVTTEPSKAWATKTVNGKKQEIEVDVPAGAEVRKFRHFWSIEDEAIITNLLHKIMLHPNCLHVGQNYLYDCQFYFRDWKLSINAFADTMVQHHVLYNYMQKDLALLASMYVPNYCYWKDELDVKDNFTRWKYNGKDVCYTFEIENILSRILERSDSKLRDFYAFQQHKVAKHIVSLMNRGVSVDIKLKEEMLAQFSELMEGCLAKLRYVFNEPEFNPNSTPQVKAAFKELLGIKPLVNRKTKTESFGADAMLVYLEEYPEWRPLLTLFLEYKSIKVFVKTFLSAKVSADGKMRCSYNIAGTKTYRLASRKDINGGGMNLQNLPSHGKIKLYYALQDVGIREEDSEEDFIDDGTEEDDSFVGTLELPNCKKMFIPPKDYIFFDADYSAIDLMFVIWESDCKFLKEVVKSGKDVYSMLAGEYYGKEITKKDPERQIFKAVCHACVTGDHEVLTKDGWINIEDLDDVTEIAVWDKDSQDIWFETPEAINRDFVQSSEDLYHIEGAAFSFLGTQDHKFPATTDIRENIKKYEAAKLPKSARIPYNGYYEGGSVQASDSYMMLMAALQADGNISHIALDGTVTYKFKFVRQRKIDRLRHILDSLEIDYKEYTQVDSTATNGNIRTVFTFHDVLTTDMKKLGWWILDYDKDCLAIWLDELKYWDGHIRTSNGVRTSISTTDKLAAEIIQTVAHLCGKASKIITKETDETRKTLYEVSLNNREFHNMSTTYSRGLVKHEGTKVYCPQTSTGYFVYRYKGNIAISSNTNYLGRPTTIAAKAGLSVPQVKKVQDFYFRMCPEILAWHKRLENDARTRGYITNVFGARCWATDTTDAMWMNKLVAWQPQSSAGILVNNALCLLEEAERKKDDGIQVLMQVHDSLAGIFHKDDVTAVARIKDYMELTIPYDDPLVIPAAIKTSTISYGDAG